MKGVTLENYQGFYNIRCTSLNNIVAGGKLFIKELIWNFLTKHKPANKKHICLYASRRSGSTLLMEVIAANKGLTFSDQPFGLYTMTPWNLNLLPLYEYGQIISMDAEEQEMVFKYIKGIFKGYTHANAPWRFWQYGGIIRSNRVVLKITDAKSIIEWIDGNFDVYTIIMTRHPIAQSLSVMRNKWAVTGKAFLRNAYFVENYLSSQQFSFCQDIYRKGSILERHVLDWALENLIPIRLLPQHPEWLFLSYEELVLNPEAIIKFLMKQLELKDYYKMINCIKRPSKSTKRASSSKTKFAIKKANVNYILQRWKKEITNNDEKKALDILEQMEISLYRKDKITPDISIIR